MVVKIKQNLAINRQIALKGMAEKVPQIWEH